MARGGALSTRIARLLQGVYGETRIDGRRASSRLPWPAPSRLPISSLSFIGFRYLLSFREFEPNLGRFTIFRRMEIGRASGEGRGRRLKTLPTISRFAVKTSTRGREKVGDGKIC